MKSLKITDVAVTAADEQTLLVHYLTMKGMVDMKENAFAILTFHTDRIEVKGFGREESRTLK